MGIQRWTISSGRSGSLKLLRRCELRLEVKIRVFKSRREGKNTETNQQKKHDELYNTKLYLEMYILFQEILNPKVIFMDF